MSIWCLYGVYSLDPLYILIGFEIAPLKSKRVGQTICPTLDFQFPIPQFPLFLLPKLLHQQILQRRLTDLLQFISHALIWFLDLHHA